MANPDGGRQPDASAAAYRASERAGIHALDIQPTDIRTAQSVIAERLEAGDSRAYMLATDFLSILPSGRIAELNAAPLVDDFTRFVGNATRGQHIELDQYLHLADEMHVLLTPDERASIEAASPRPASEQVERDLAYRRDHGNRGRYLPLVAQVKEHLPEMAGLPAMQIDDGQWRTHVAMMQAPYDEDSTAHFILQAAALKRIDPQRWAESMERNKGLLNEAIWDKMNHALDYYRQRGKVDFFWTLARAMTTLAA